MMFNPWFLKELVCFEQSWTTVQNLQVLFLGVKLIFLNVLELYQLFLNNFEWKRKQYCFKMSYRLRISDIIEEIRRKERLAVKEHKHEIKLAGCHPTHLILELM